MNEQEKQWAGKFGDDYTCRNVGQIVNNEAFFKKVLPRVRSLMEFGAGSGMNLWAIKSLYPRMDLCAVEINEFACQKLKNIEGLTVINSPVSVLKHNRQYDLVLSKGFLIHQPPHTLDSVYRDLFIYSRKYILIAEYYNPVPVEVNYRGNENMMWKRDFAGDMLDRFKELRLADYGFVYYRDRYPQDDLNYFLLEKI